MRTGDCFFSFELRKLKGILLRVGDDWRGKDRIGLRSSEMRGSRLKWRLFMCFFKNQRVPIFDVSISASNAKDSL